MSGNKEAVSDGVIQPVLKPTIYVGNKPLKRYVSAVMALFYHGENVVEIAGRGQKIYRVVGIAEILKRQRKCTVKNIKIGTDTFTDKNGVERRKSYMIISVKKPRNLKSQPRKKPRSK